ncbi:MAG: hypothetical protein B7C55_04570 [Actinomycetales bacterium mxb001]|nr:MAG: hypothetical protein B7C55_04570 [Actinomycetales bacterium mxb001]
MCEANELAKQQERAAAEKERAKQRQEELNAQLIRDRVKHHYDEFTGHHFLEVTSPVSFHSKQHGTLEGQVETVLQLEFTKDLTADFILVGFRRVGTDWQWMHFFNDQLFFILGGDSHQATDPYTYFHVIDGGVFEMVGFSPSETQTRLLISDNTWRVRAGFWEAQPKWPTHEVFQEAFHRKAAILSES